MGSRFESHHSRGQSGGQNESGGDGAGAGAGHGKKLAQEEADEALKREGEEKEEKERRLWKLVERKRVERDEGHECVSFLSSTLSPTDASNHIKGTMSADTDH